jgi:hypothetical protein
MNLLRESYERNFPKIEHGIAKMHITGILVYHWGYCHYLYHIFIIEA